MGASPPKAIDAAPAKETVRFVGIVGDRQQNARLVLRLGAYDKRNVQRWPGQAAEPRRPRGETSVDGRWIWIRRENRRRPHSTDIQAARAIGGKLEAANFRPLRAMLVGGA